jgi:L-asparaginase II
MSISPYLPIFELTRGDLVESIHYGAVAVVDSHGALLASYGDPETVTYLRSSAKPLQALAFIEAGGADKFDLSLREIAIMCASHSGTNEHVAVLAGIQKKIGVSQDDLLCGVHPPSDKSTAETLFLQGEQPTPNRHNCSGKHTGMLAYARFLDLPIEDYINPQHPIQKQILQTFSEMCGMEPESVAIGTDGCSAPNFSIPLKNAALGLARLCDPKDLSASRAKACRTITQAMIAHPEMIAGPGKFDTRLIGAARGQLISKGGAEGYQVIGLQPGAMGEGSPGIGIAFKISDGDLRSRARPAITLEILRQLGLQNPPLFESLADLGPSFPIYNFRELQVGAAYPVFKLKVEGSAFNL